MQYVIGLGITGLSVVNFLLRHGEAVTVWDTRENPPGADQLPSDVELICGPLDAQRLSQASRLIVNPGIALATPAIAQAIAAGVEVIGDIELFARYCDAPVIAITGSNGKSTVTTMVGEMAAAAGWSVGVGGNIGVPALDLLGKGHQLFVLELSSFQLETTSSLRPVAATILNISEDHMDRYDGMAAYIAAKQRIYHNSALAIVNADDAQTVPVAIMPEQRFGIEQGDYHLIRGAHGFALAYQGEEVLACDQLQVTGLHNYSNALAALALCDAAGVPRQASIDALCNFSGLAHRCTLVGNKQGVLWVNDSKATNVGATLAAIAGLKPTISGKLHLLLGGDGKGADFSDLIPALADCGLVLCFGRDGQQLARLREDAQLFSTMTQAILYAAKYAQAGDMVLLSPACASLDQFANYAARGDAFAQAVEAL